MLSHVGLSTEARLLSRRLRVAMPVAGLRRAKPLPRLLGAAMAKAVPLSWLLLALGTLGALCLPLASKKIFFDENSLNIGSSHAYIRCGAIHPQCVVCIAASTPGLRV